MQHYLTIKEASALTGKSDATVRRLLRRKLKSAYAEAMQVIRQTKTPSGFVYTMDRAFLEREGLLPTQPPRQGAMQNQNPPTQNHADDQAVDENPAETAGVTGSHPPRQTPMQESRGVESGALVEALAGTIDVLKNQLAVKDGQLATRDRQIERLIEDRERTDILLGNLQNRIYALEAPPARRQRPITDQEEGTPADQDTEPAGPEPAPTTRVEVVEHAPDSPQEPGPEAPAPGAHGAAKRRGFWPFSRN